MTDPIFVELERTSTLAADEVIGVGAPRESLDELNRQFVKYFPDHAHVTGELDAAWSGVGQDPANIVHAWLFRLDGEPVGFAVMNTNVHRQILLQHYIGMDPAAGRRLPMRWVGYLLDAVTATGMRDCGRAGTALLGQMGEHHEEHLRAWSRFGFITLDIDYREPYHGRHWPDFGEPAFFPMFPQLRPTPAGSLLPFSQVATAGASAFLLDHYGLPADNPTVAHTLALAAALPG